MDIQEQEKLKSKLEEVNEELDANTQTTTTSKKQSKTKSSSSSNLLYKSSLITAQIPHLPSIDAISEYTPSSSSNPTSSSAQLTYSSSSSKTSKKLNKKFNKLQKKISSLIASNLMETPPLPVLSFKTDATSIKSLTSNSRNNKKTNEVTNLESCTNENVTHLDDEDEISEVIKLFLSFLS